MASSLLSVVRSTSTRKEQGDVELATCYTVPHHSHCIVPFTCAPAALFLNPVQELLAVFVEQGCVLRSRALLLFYPRRSLFG